MTWKTEEHYYSGQGQVLLATRNADGSPAGFLPLGNVSALKIAIATSVIEHKESQTGARGIDKRLTTEVKCNLSMTVDNFIRTNLAQALRGTTAAVAAAAVTAAAVVGYLGAISSVGKINLSALTPKIASTPLTPYVNDATAWDVKTNLAMGSFQLNDGSVTSVDTLASITATALTVGATTAITATHSLAVGDKVLLQDFSGADAALINKQIWTVTAVTGTTAFSVNANTTGKTITFTGGKAAPYKRTLSVDYTNPQNYLVDALTTSAQELYMRFEGLNTAESNDPVVIEVFKFSVDPLKELSLITDTFQQFQLDGSVLADLLRSSGSPYFNVLKTN